jgi:hypothetical protein
MFKRSVSPVYSWGENGLITVPKATTLGKMNFHFGSSVRDSGKIEGDQLFLTSFSVMAGTSDDVEFGYTKRQFIWDDLDKTDLEMDTYHFKARVFHMADTFIPQLALGMNAVSLGENEFSNEEDILFNPYLAATIQIPVFSKNLMLSATAVAESLYNEGESSDLFFSAGADLCIYEKLYLIAEVQGLNKEDEDAIVNLGAKFKTGWFSLGVSMFNAIENDVDNEEDGADKDNSYFMAYAAVEIPFGKMFTTKNTKEETK